MERAQAHTQFSSTKQIVDHNSTAEGIVEKDSSLKHPRKIKHRKQANRKE